MKTQQVAVLLGLVGAIALSTWLLIRLRVPAAPMIAAMLIVAAAKLSGVSVPEVPRGGTIAAFIVVGWILGQDIDPSITKVLSRAAVPAVAVVISLILVGVLLAWALITFAHVDQATALLSTSPGGVAQMAVLATEMEANVGVVIVVHLLRLFAVILLTPLIIAILD